jgi:hypothetical protein
MKPLILITLIYLVSSCSDRAEKRNLSKEINSDTLPAAVYEKLFRTNEPGPLKIKVLHEADTSYYGKNATKDTTTTVLEVSMKARS